MKKFEIPEIEIALYAVEDVIATSGVSADGEFGNAGEDD